MLLLSDGETLCGQEVSYIALVRPFPHPEEKKKLILGGIIFLRPHLWHMEVPRLEVELELQLSAYTTATATLDLNRLCYLHHSSQQHCILNSLSLARDRTQKLMVTSRILFCCATTGTPVW